MTNLAGLPPMGLKVQAFVSPDLRKFAKGKPCQMGTHCDGSDVVLCHSRRGAGSGMAQKPHDFWGYHGCGGCHRNEHHVSDFDLMQAIRRTQYAVYAHFGTLTP